MWCYQIISCWKTTNVKMNPNERQDLMSSVYAAGLINHQSSHWFKTGGAGGDQRFVSARDRKKSPLRINPSHFPTLLCMLLHIYPAQSAPCRLCNGVPLPALMCSVQRLTAAGLDQGPTVQNPNLNK